MSDSVSGLTQEQIDHYWANGYLSGIPILTQEQTAIARRKLIELERMEIERDPEQWADKNYTPWDDRKNPWWHWFLPMATHPRILAAVQSLLGPNVLIRNADIFVKPAKNERSISWHVDCTASEKEAGKLLTVWFAISDSAPRNGCMEFLKGSHRMTLPKNIMDKTSLTFTGTALERCDLAERQSNILRPGEISLHHFRTVHRSSGNETNVPRIGFVVRFMAADATREAAESGKAYLASGTDTTRNFTIEKTFPVTWQRSQAGDMQPDQQG